MASSSRWQSRKGMVAGSISLAEDFGWRTPLSTMAHSFCLPHHLCSDTLWEQTLQIPLGLSSPGKRYKKVIGMNYRSLPSLCSWSWGQTDQFLLPLSTQSHSHPASTSAGLGSLAGTMIQSHILKESEPLMAMLSSGEICCTRVPSELGTGIQRDIQMDGRGTKHNSLVQQCWMTWGNMN